MLLADFQSFIFNRCVVFGAMDVLPADLQSLIFNHSVVSISMHVLR